VTGVYNEYDAKVYRERLAGFLPARIIDVHTHIWKAEFVLMEDTKGCVTWPARVASECTVGGLLEIYATFFPRQTVTPVLMGSPLCDLGQTNAYTKECGAKCALPTMYCTAWDTPPERLRTAVVSEGFAGFKPYLNNSPGYIPPGEVRIYDFLPHEHLRVTDELEAVVMLHIARAGRLRDPVNIAQLMEIDRQYPNAKIIVAHVGRAYIEDDLGDAFDTLRHSKNLLFDFSANTLEQAMTACIGAVGPERVMFGSDMPITKMRMYRIAEDGVYKNVIPRGLYGDVSGDKNMKETDEADVTTFIYEELLAFRRATEALGLGKDEIEDILCNNAKRVFNIN